MKKIFIFLLLGLFLISFASAFEFDNTYEYNEQSTTATIHNCDIWVGFCLNQGEVLAEVTRTSPHNVMVARGLDQLVGEFNFTTTGDFQDVFGEMYLTDMKNDNEISRGKQYKYKKYTNRSVDDYETQCNNVTAGNGTTIQECSQVEIGSHWEVQMDWIPVGNPSNIFYENQTYEIGVFVDVEQGDHGDWRPSILGIEIVEWSEWTESLNVNLMAYYKLDEASGTVIDSVNLANGTNNGATPNVAGKLPTADPKAYDFEKSESDYISLGDNLDIATGELSISAWVKREGLGADNNWILAKDDNTKGRAYSFGFDTTNHLTVQINGVAAISDGTVTDTTNFVHVVMTYDDSADEVKFYINGALDSTKTNVAVISTNTADARIGSREYSGSEGYFDGVIDEVAPWNRVISPTEVTQLWNNSFGISYIGVFGIAPSVVLTSPTNNSNLTSSNVQFIATVTDDLQVDNVTLYIDGVLNETNSSGFNGTYTFNKFVSEGIHNWSILAIDNDSLQNQSEEWIFNYTQPPINIQLNNPSDAFISQVPIVFFNCSADDPLGVEELNLTINGTVEETLVNSTEAENLTLTKNVTLAEGIYPWGCSAINEMSFAESSNRTLNVSYSLPVISLDLPINNSNKTLPDLNFTFNASDINGLDNVSLYIDGVFDQINSSGLNGEYLFSKTLGEGLYNWTIIANSILSKQAISETRIFNITFSSPEVTLNSPGDGTNTTNESVTFNFTATDDNGIDNVSFFINDLLNETNVSSFNGTYIIDRVLSEGFYNWSVVANSIFGKQTISAVNSFIVHLTAPTATITAPSGTIDYILLGENETLTYDFSESGQNISEHLEECWYVYGGPTEERFLSNSSFEDCCSGSNDRYWDFRSGVMYTSPNVDTLIIDLALPSPGLILRADLATNGLSISQFTSTLPNCNSELYGQNTMFSADTIGYFACIEDESGFKYLITQNNYNVYLTNFTSYNITQDLNCSATETNFTYIQGLNNISIFARDTFGFIGTDTSTWEYSLIEINQTYEEIIFQTESNNFEVIIESQASSLTSPKLIYKGESNTATLEEISSGVYSMTASSSIDEDSAGNNSFFWNITLDGIEYSTSLKNQTVELINFSICDATNNITYLSIDFRDESTLDPLNAIIRTATFNYYIEDPLAALTYTYSTPDNSSKYDFCFDQGTLNITVDASISYYANGYPERTSGTEAILSNQTTNLTLDLLNDESGLYATFKFVDSTTKIGLSDVSVQIFDGITLVITKITDDGGTISEWLNPNILYEVIYAKEGYAGGSQSHRPISTDTILIEMSSDALISDPSITNGLTQYFYPQLSNLENDTIYNFGYFTSEGEEEISTMKFTIYDEDGVIISSTEKANDGNMTQIPINTVQNRTLLGVYEINGVDGGYYKFTRTYYVTSITSTQYSLDQWGRSLNTYFPADERTTLTNLIWYITWFICMLGGFTFGFNGSFKKREDYTDNVVAGTRGNTTTGLFFAFIITLIFTYFNAIPMPIGVINPGFLIPDAWMEQNFMGLIILVVLVWDVLSGITKHSRRGN